MKYERENGTTALIDDKGERTPLANFTATITEEIRYIDGRNTETYLVLTGEQSDPDAKKIGTLRPLPPVTVRADQFPGMQWAMQQWGVRAVIYPGSGIRDELRTAIQLISKPKITTIYRHLGWTTIHGKRAYIHGTGAINNEANDSSIAVQLPPELCRYDLSCLTKKTSKAEIKAAIQATLDLTAIGPDHITWPLLAATFAPLFGAIDFAVHLTGKTGTYKSELLSLFQSHYGAGMDARHLPGSWSSTSNAIEAQAFLAANAVYVLDDFVPNGTASQQRSYQQNADKIIRSQGNQAGRARLTDTSNLQTAMYPRGIILSTGEDTPEGHSVRARMLILEMSPGDIPTAKLTAAQANRSKYPLTTARLIASLADQPIDLTQVSQHFRDQCIEIGHARTPSMIGQLLATLQYFLLWAELHGVHTAGLFEIGQAGILQAARQQAEYLETSDPCDQFIAAIRTAFATYSAHARTLNGGTPRGATQLGWTQLGQDEGDIPTFRSNGPCIGWVQWNTNELLLEVHSGFAAVKKQSGSDIALTKQTLLKRLKDSGKLKRIDTNRQRNTVRITAENHPRQVISLCLSEVLESTEAQIDD